MFSKAFQRKYALTDQGLKNTKSGAFWTVVTNLVVMGGMGILYLLMGGFMGTLTDGAPLPGAALPLALTLGFVLLSFVTHLQQYRATYGLVYGEVKTTRLNLAERLRKLPLGYFGKRDLADLTETLMGDVNRMEHVWSHVLGYLYGAYISTSIIAVCLLVYDWRLAILGLLFTPVSYVCAAGMKKPVQRAGAAYKKAAGALSSATLDRARNAVTYRIYGCEEARMEKYEEALSLYEKTAVRSNVWQSALPPLYLAASEAGTLFILWFGAKNVLGTGWSSWDIAAFTTFLSCFTKLVVKSSKVAKLFNAVQKAEVSWKRIRPLMKTPEQLDALQIPAAQDVTLKELAFSYGEEPVFSGLSLTAHPGDIIGITGPVACGKSTLGRVFLCEAPYQGSVCFGGREFSALTPRQIAATVGYLGHDPELSADTVQNNVLCGSEQDAMPWLAAVALKEEVLAMEKGTETVIGSGGTRLSGGQAQRLALARTLAHPRPVLVLDDPFSALDRSTEDAIFAELQAYARDKVVFLISHRLYHFPQMQQIIFMEGGRTTVGTHEELMAAVPVYRQLYESQTGLKGGEGA